jgi:hypothetical protein
MNEKCPFITNVRQCCTVGLLCVSWCVGVVIAVQSDALFLFFCKSEEKNENF